MDSEQVVISVGPGKRLVPLVIPIVVDPHGPEVLYAVGGRGFVSRWPGTGPTTQQKPSIESGVQMFEFLNPAPAKRSIPDLVTPGVNFDHPEIRIYYPA